MAAYLACPWCNTETPDTDVPLASADELVCPTCGKTCSFDDMIEREAE